MVSLSVSCLHPPPLAPIFSLAPSIPSLFPSHVESIICCLVERESKHPRLRLRASRVGVGGGAEVVGIVRGGGGGGDSLSPLLSLGPDTVWTKGGLVISEPQHPIVDRLLSPTALDWKRA